MDTTLWSLVPRRRLLVKDRSCNHWYQSQGSRTVCLLCGISVDFYASHGEYRWRPPTQELHMHSILNVVLHQRIDHGYLKAPSTPADVSWVYCNHECNIALWFHSGMVVINTKVTVTSLEICLWSWFTFGCRSWGTVQGPFSFSCSE